jgi:hypothetical protein
VFIALKELRARVVEEAGMGAEASEEIGQGVTEVQFALQSGEFCEEAGDLAKTDLMDGLWWRFSCC